MHTLSFLNPYVLVFLLLFGLFGLVAVVSPRRFRAVSTWSSRWFDSSKGLAIFDKRFNVDDFVFRHSRITGVLVIISVSVLGYLWMLR